MSGVYRQEYRQGAPTKYRREANTPLCGTPRWVGGILGLPLSQPQDLKLKQSRGTSTAVLHILLLLTLSVKHDDQAGLAGRKTKCMTLLTREEEKSHRLDVFPLPQPNIINLTVL